MPSYNKCILIGNLTTDPELRYLPKGTALCEFNLAVNRKWKDDTGQMKEECAFLGIKAWGKQAETICQYLKKGRPLMVEGRVAQETWDDKTSGQKRSKTLIVLESFQFLGDGGSREGSQTAPRGGGIPSDAHKTPPPVAPAAASGGAAPDDEESDVPFRQIPPARIQFSILGFAGNKLK